MCMAQQVNLMRMKTITLVLILVVMSIPMSIFGLENSNQELNLVDSAANVNPLAPANCTSLDFELYRTMRGIQIEPVTDDFSYVFGDFNTFLREPYNQVNIVDPSVSGFGYFISGYNKSTCSIDWYIQLESIGNSLESLHFQNMRISVSPEGEFALLMPQYTLIEATSVNPNPLFSGLTTFNYSGLSVVGTLNININMNGEIYYTTLYKSATEIITPIGVVALSGGDRIVSFRAYPPLPTNVSLMADYTYNLIIRRENISGQTIWEEVSEFFGSTGAYLPVATASDRLAIVDNTLLLTFDFPLHYLEDASTSSDMLYMKANVSGLIVNVSGFIVTQQEVGGGENTSMMGPLGTLIIALKSTSGEGIWYNSIRVGDLISGEGFGGYDSKLRVDGKVGENLAVSSEAFCSLHFIFGDYTLPRVKEINTGEYSCRSMNGTLNMLDGTLQDLRIHDCECPQFGVSGTSRASISDGVSHRIGSMGYNYNEIMTNFSTTDPDNYSRVLSSHSTSNHAFSQATPLPYLAEITEDGTWKWDVDLEKYYRYTSMSDVNSVNQSTTIIVGSYSEYPTRTSIRWYVDIDDDGVPDEFDQCLDGDTDWFIHDASNDLDGDGCNDKGEDNDDDNDGILDIDDRCNTPLVQWTSTPQNDADRDGCRDIDQDDDDDNDGILDVVDRCNPSESNWSSNQQNDYDADGCEDITEDIDDDNDGIPDISDDCPQGWSNWTYSAALDYDMDGCLDSGEDYDDDNDGIPDISDECPKEPIPLIDLDANGCEDDEESVEEFQDNSTGNNSLLNSTTNTSGELDETEAVNGGNNNSNLTIPVDDESTKNQSGIIQQPDEPLASIPLIISISGILIAALASLKILSYQSTRMSFQKLLISLGVLGAFGSRKSTASGEYRREEILAFIKSHPGVNYYTIGKETGLAKGQVAYHLHLMTLSQQIQEYRYKKKLCFFDYFIDLKLIEKSDIDAICDLKWIDRTILDFFGEVGTGYFDQKLLANILGSSQPTVSRRLKILYEKKLLMIVELENDTSYSLTDEAIRILKTFNCDKELLN